MAIPSIGYIAGLQGTFKYQCNQTLCFILEILVGTGHCSDDSNAPKFYKECVFLEQLTFRALAIFAGPLGGWNNGMGAPLQAYHIDWKQPALLLLKVKYAFEITAAKSKNCFKLNFVSFGQSRGWLFLKKTKQKKKKAN